MQDAIGHSGIVAADEARRRERRDALQWFVENGHDYQMACDAAGIDAEYLRRRVMRMATRAHVGEVAVDPGIGDLAAE